MGGHLPRSGAARGSKCAPPCGPEAACRHFPNSTSLCVCVHDASPAAPGRKCPRVAIPVSLRSIPVIVPTNGTNGSLWRTSLQQAPGQLPPKPTAPSWAAGTLQTAAAVSLLLVALLLSTAVTCIWRRLLAVRSATVPSAAPQHFTLSDGEDGLSGTEECLLEVERDTAHDASRRPRPPAPAPS
ncbi:uncharacterized protein LOC124795496 [Schistocerca piceifrons]|uniref:uncharacterized protein LOC124795496 n=1 Tax=Schistocerca piceifrons TaxID=274613 RepID=UPI001F5F42DD|nr:uncharacterized protein LOC124795496 [Schistocerca piceifrons]